MDSYARLIAGLPDRLSVNRVQRGGAKATRAAIAALPLANPAEAARGLERLLDGMLTAAWPGAERLEALESVRGPVDALCSDVERRIGAESHPLAQSSLEWVATAQRLQWKLGAAHALALHELCAPGGKLPMFKGRQAAAAATRALLHLDRALLWAYRRYTAPAQGTWRLAHALHAFALESGMAAQPDEAADPGHAALSANTVYAHALLMAMSNPYRFTARELQMAEQVLGCVAASCHVAPALAGAPGVALDPDTDLGPGYIAEDRVHSGEGLLMIDPAPARQAFEENIAMRGAATIDLRRPGGGSVATSAAFLQRLAAAWAPASRAHARLGAAHRLDVVVGMRALHYALAGDVDFESFLRRAVADAIDAGGPRPAAWLAPADAAPPTVFSGEVLDQSEGGYRMHLAATEGLRLHIGEVIGLALPVEDFEPRDWMVGMIRWLRQDGDEVWLGVELVARSARAAGMRAAAGHGEPPAATRAVLLDDACDAAGLSLLLAGVFARDVESLASLELVLPAAASDWQARTGLMQLPVRTTHALGSDCFRLELDRPVEAGKGAGSAYTGRAATVAP